MATPEKKGPAADPSSSTSSGGIQKSSHPFVELQEHGIADILDVADLKAHLPESKRKELLDLTKRLRASKPTERRLDSHVGSFVVNFDVSIKDLLEFSCKREALSSGESPCIARPFATTAPVGIVSNITPDNFLQPLLSGLEYKRDVIPAVCAAKLVKNEFEGVLKDEIKMGCSMTEKYLEVLRVINPSDLMVENYRMGLVRGDLTFTASSKMANVLYLQPQLPDGELNRMCTTAFLTRESVERGVVKHKVTDDKTCYYFPEEHGLAHYLKIAGPSVVSGIRVFTLGMPHDSSKLKEGQKNPKVFVRLQEKSYKSLVERIMIDELHPKLERKFCFRDLTFWLGYKIKDEEWSDPKEKERLKALPYEEFTKKRRISFKVNVALLTLATPHDQDLFWSSDVVIGSYLPGVPYVDGCTLKKKEEKDEKEKKPADVKAAESVVPQEQQHKSRAYKDIKPRELPYYLAKNYDERRAFKTDPAKMQSHKEALLDL